MKRELTEKAARLLDDGYTQQQTAEQLLISERTLRDWKSKGLLKRVGGADISPERRVPKAKSVRRDINAYDLKQANFFNENLIPMILASLETAQRQGNYRLNRFLANVIDRRKEWPEMPFAWLSVVAGFPVLAEDINVSSFAELAELVGKIHPYLNKQCRKEYHRRARPILSRILADVQEVLVKATIQSGELISVEHQYSPDEVQDGLPEGDSLRVSIPAPLNPRNAAWILYDIARRLPDPDRQTGGTELTILDLLYTWCSTAFSDFKPQLSLTGMAKT